MIYVVTAVRNRFKITQKFIERIKRQTYSEIKLIMVDDGSTDGTADMVLSEMPDAVIIKGNGNLWWAGALHEVYKWIKINIPTSCDKDYVMIANDDTEFDDTYIERAIKVLEGKEKTLLTGYGISRQTGKVVDATVVMDFVSRDYSLRGEGYGNCASTRSLFFRVEDFKIIGGFHPILLPHYASDHEWTIRACRKYGYKVYCDKTINYYSDETTTGDNFYDTLTRKKLFSKRSVSNPIYKINYIILSTPIRYLPVQLFSQLKRYFKKKELFFKVLKKH